MFNRLSLLFPIPILALLVSSALAAPRGVRLSYRDDPTSTMAISWTSDSATENEIVYGIDTAALTNSVVAQQHFVQPAPLNHSFSAQLSGLSSSTIYYYRVGNAGNYHPPVGSAPFSFKTMSNDPCDPFVFVLLGDNRADFDDIGPSPLWAEILEEALAHNPDFFVNTGDMVKNGDAQGEWSNFIEASEPGWALIPSLLTIGNHDDQADNGPTAFYSQLFEFPRNSQNGWENYYGIDVGPIRFASLDSNINGAPFLDMVSWLGTDLASSVQPWKIVFFHHAIYSRGNHYTGEEDGGYLNTNLIPEFDTNDVDFVFNGHSHNYERYAPSLGVDPEFGGGGRSFPNGNGAANGPGSTLPDGATGTTYMVSGGAGALTTEIGGFECIDAGCTLCTGFNLNCDQDVLDRDVLGTALYEGKHNFAVFRVNGSQIDVEVWTTDAGNSGGGDMVDHFTMISSDECESPTGLVTPTPRSTQLHPNRPNPFNPATSIRFSLAEPTPVRLTIHDVSGRLVDVLLDELYPAGEYATTWHGRDSSGRFVGSGVYIYTLETNRGRESRRMVVVR